jgi:RES domain-containing protein
MIVYRLCKEKRKNDLSGKGSELTGGRWNSKGIAMLYTSESRALCTTEIAVHSPLGIIPSHYWIITIEFPDTIDTLEIDETALPADWNTFPHQHCTQALGDDFITTGKYLVMKAPSAVVQGDFNYLINPAHSLFVQVKIKETEPFEFDERLFVR